MMNSTFGRSTAKPPQHPSVGDALAATEIIARDEPRPSPV
jgi:hypothetical protein